MSEVARWRWLVLPYCHGNGVDLGPAGDPVCPGALGIDLREGMGQWKFDCRHLPFLDASLDYVFSSHLIEDLGAEEQPQALAEWARVVRAGGYLVILWPDRERFAEAIARGQTPNCCHRREGEVGLLTRMLQEVPGEWEVISDLLIDRVDYNILFVAWRVR